jgi:aspartate carbamoyltransferase catalytic subunit
VYLLHPGPVNYGIELAHDLAYHPKNLIFTQVTNGVWTRMVLLEELHKARGARQ